MDFKTVVSSLMALEGQDTRGMKITVETALNMLHILSGSEEDFVLFSNDPTEAFTIWRGKALTQMMVALPDADTYIYAYRYQGNDTVIMVPDRVDDRTLVWRRLDERT